MKYGAMCLILFCVLASALLGAQRVSAAAFSWTSGEPTVYRSESTVFEDQPYCPTYIQKLRIEGLANEQSVCIFSNNGLKVGSFLEDGRTGRVAIAYPLDNSFHILSGVCEGLAGCLYSADQDSVVSRYGKGIRVYGGMKNRIHQSLGLDPLGVSYNFDTSDPLYTALDESGAVLPVGAIALSNNGKWLVMEIENKGIGLVNLETGATKRVIAPGYQYNRGFDPREELAVSNDGTSVVAMGDNAGLTFVSVDPGCGDGLVESLTADFLYGTKPCARVGIDLSSFIQSFTLGMSPKFDDSGGQLEFVAGSRGVGAKRVELRASGYEGSPGLGYLALGDSFSSGEGETDDRYYELGTDNEFEKCHVSIRSYPFLLAAAMQIASTAVKNVACSGATTKDISNHEIGYWGQGGRLGPLGLRLSSDGLLDAQTNSLLGFLPGRVLQETFAQQYQPDIVTVGIGGNDAGFMDKLKVCAMPGICEWAASQDGRHIIGLEIQGLFSKLASLYQQLKLDAPFAHLYAVGYPEVIDPVGTCDPLTAILFATEERALASEGIKYLNQVIRAASNEADIPYLDIEQSLSGRELCENTGLSSAVNGLRLGNDIAPSSLLPMLKIIGKESFHPNPTGHELIADAILSQQPDLHSGGSCDCSTTSKPPPLPDDWANGEVTRGTPENTDFISPIDIAQSVPIFAFSITAGSLEPGSTVDLEVHSEATKLGTFVVGADGSLAGEANLPSNLEEGFHTVHLYGDSFSHQPVDLYQVISFGDQLGASTSSVATSEVLPSPALESTGVLGYSTSNPVRDSIGAIGAVGNPEKCIAEWSLVTIIASVILCISGLACAVYWRVRHNSTQDRGG